MEEPLIQNVICAMRVWPAEVESGNTVVEVISHSRTRPAETTTLDDPKIVSWNPARCSVQKLSSEVSHGVSQVDATLMSIKANGSKYSATFERVFPEDASQVWSLSVKDLNTIAIRDVRIQQGEEPQTHARMDPRKPTRAQSITRRMHPAIPDSTRRRRTWLRGLPCLSSTSSMGRTLPASCTGSKAQAPPPPTTRPLE